MNKNKHNEKVGSFVERTDEIPKKIMEDPTSTFLDNSCGSGNFLVGLKQVLTEEYGYDPEHVIDNMLYGVDLMEDNIKETCSRLGVEFGHPHFVVADALEYDYSFGEPIGLECFFD